SATSLPADPPLVGVDCRSADPAGVLEREPQRLGPQAPDRPARDEARELRRRVAATDGDDRDAGRNLLEPGRERRALGVAGARVVKVVEHEHAAGGHPREELAEPAAGEAG